MALISDESYRAALVELGAAGMRFAETGEWLNRESWVNATTPAKVFFHGAVYMSKYELTHDVILWTSAGGRITLGETDGRPVDTDRALARFEKAKTSAGMGKKTKKKRGNHAKATEEFGPPEPAEPAEPEPSILTSVATSVFGMFCAQPPAACDVDDDDVDDEKTSAATGMGELARKLRAAANELQYQACGPRM
jgi:hypothetical protein